MVFSGEERASQLNGLCLELLCVASSSIARHLDSLRGGFASKLSGVHRAGSSPKADGWAFLVARHLRFSNRGDPLCCCQRIEGLGRVLAMAFQEGRRGSWANPVRA